MALLKETETESRCTIWCSDSLENGSMVRSRKTSEQNNKEISCENVKWLNILTIFRDIEGTIKNELLI
jgi:hypothetical protein